MSVTPIRKPKRPTMPFESFIPSVADRLKCINRTLLLAGALIDRHDSGSNAVTLDAHVAEALANELMDAHCEAFWLLKLDDETLALSAPDDDQAERLDEEDAGSTSPIADVDPDNDGGAS